jgi:carboxypeptidase C (cathepsin A)
MRLKYVLLLAIVLATAGAAHLIIGALPSVSRDQAAALPSLPPVSSAKLMDVMSEVDGVVTIAGKKIEYRATADRIALKDNRTDKATAYIFFTAYTRKGAQPNNRPIAFCFNGGPGASSLWLHLGAFGPRRVSLPEDGKRAPRNVEMVDNESSLLDVTDLVFIDPVSTGFSRAHDPSVAWRFHGVLEDVRAIGQFIDRYIARYDRIASPIYLVGESYGAARAARLAHYIQGAARARPVGVVLVSGVLDFQTIGFDEGNDLPYSLSLPSYTATAWYHGKLDKNLRRERGAVVEESRRFADTEYAQALRMGNQLDDAKRRAIAKKLAAFTGLSEEFVLRANLRVTPTHFRKELLADRSQVIGSYDSRINLGIGVRDDPSLAVLWTPFMTGWHGYVASELKYESSETYEMITNSVHPWNYGETATNRYLNVAPHLRWTMEKNPSLRVLVASGYFDLATPFAGMEYTLAHFGPRSLTDRIAMTYYDAGHMMYTHHPSRLNSMFRIA